MSSRLVFVRGEGVAKQLEASGDEVTVQLSSSFRRLTVPRARVRELMAHDAAQRILAELRSPLAGGGPETTAAEATAQLAERDDPAVFAKLLRGLYGKPQADEDVLPRLTLESFLSLELSAVLGVPRAQLDFVSERPKKKRGDGAWLRALKTAGVKGAALDVAVRAVWLPRGAEPFTTWRRAVGALLPLGMYPIIADASLQGLAAPDEALASCAGALRVAAPAVAPPRSAKLGRLERPVLAVSPFPQPWLALAYLRFGGFNACPSPAEHASRFCRWCADWGALPVSIDGSGLEAVVGRGPRSGRDVARVAREHLAYCEDLSLRSAGRRATAVKATAWSFWWD